MDKLGVGDENESGWEDPPRLGGEPSLITPMEADDNEDVSTGKVGKKDKGSYQKAYKLALKKYQIHSADELDTPAERKGFTAYVDKLWKGGEVKDHALPEVSREEKARRKVAIGKETKKRDKAQADRLKKRVAGSEKTAAEKNKEKLAAQRERNKKAIARKAEQEKKRRDQEQQSKEREKEQEKRQREREQQQSLRDKTKELEKDNGADSKDDDKKDKKKSSSGLFKGLAGIVKQAADKEKSFVGR